MNAGLFRSTLLLAASAALIAGATVVHGLRTDRWGRAAVLDEAAKALKRVPARLDEWQGTDVELDDRQLQVGEIDSYLAREYVHLPSGRRATVLVLCGRPGAIGAHTPDICYQGAGFSMAGATGRRDLKGAAVPAEFATATAAKAGPPPEALSIWWSWSDKLEKWEAPARDARWRFAWSPVLFKMYVVRRIAPGRAEPPEDLEAASALAARLAAALSRP